jgi:hypothetical protein
MTTPKLTLLPPLYFVAETRLTDCLAAWPGCPGHFKSTRNPPMVDPLRLQSKAN